MNRKAAALRRSDGEDTGSANHGPGPRLRDGRLARSMTLEEAAELLKLDPSVLASLERDDFTALPETLYVRGYLASYARLLGIPEQEVVRDYLAFTGDASAPTLTARRPIEGAPASSDTGLRWFSYGLMIGIVALVGWWGYQRLPLESPATAVTASVDLAPESAQTPPPEPPVFVATETEMPPEIELLAQPEPVEPESTQVEVAAYTALPEGDERVAAESDPASPASEDSMAPTVSEPEPIAEEVAVAGDAEVEPIAEDLALAGDAGVEPKQADLNANMDSDDISVDGGERSLDILSLSFSRDCWVEIHDARQQRLVYGLAKAGSSRRVEGEAPFQILVGDSGAVDIRLNGKPTARSRYDAGEGRPARFSLSGEMLETASAP